MQCPNCGMPVADPSEGCEYCDDRRAPAPPPAGRGEVSESLRNSINTERQAASWERRGRRDRANLRRALFYGALTTAVFSLLGFVLVSSDHGYLGGFGVVIFLLLPSAAGFAAVVTGGPRGFWKITLTMTFVVSVAVLLLSGLEKLLCVVMASPIILGGLALGALLGRRVRPWCARSGSGKVRPEAFFVLALSLSVLGAHHAERRYFSGEIPVSVVDMLNLASSPEAVWLDLQTLDSIDSPVPALMRLGLPRPLRCEVAGEGVGSRRLCVFSSGTIDERVTLWEPPSRLEVDVVETTLPGRLWLRFIRARYALERTPDGTRLIRETVIGSTLRPRWYWRPLESLGVRTVHRYLFHELKRRSAARAH